MTQRISASHLDQLTAHQKHNLRRWWSPQIGDWFLDSKGNERLYAWSDGLMRAKSDGMFDPAYDLDDPKLLPLLSIGQMIEYIEESHNTTLKSWQEWDVAIDQGVGTEKHFSAPQLVDALWAACKEVLAHE
jgi:hypothetical protein